MLFMILYALRIISLHKTLNFVYFLQKPDIHTDGPTDIPSYRDARTHLKTLAKRDNKIGFRNVSCLSSDFRRGYHTITPAKVKSAIRQS